MVEYRGYGRSEVCIKNYLNWTFIIHLVEITIIFFEWLKGTPSEKGLYADAQAAFEYIDAREDLDSKKIILFGRSLGMLGFKIGFDI